MATATPSSFPSMQSIPKLDPASLLPPFEGSLPATLRSSGERSLLRHRALTRDIYSTQRFLSDSPNSSTRVLRTIPVARGDLFLCEACSTELVGYAEKHGLRLASAVDADRAIDVIEAALLTVIEPYPFLWLAVSELAWRCHIVLAPDDDYDVSFSDPAIPFSIFISAPARNDRCSILRAAESLIHETMHLQLSLFENLSPLVDTASTWSAYSPWKQRERPVQGVLHGLYVFCVLRWMWRQVSKTTQNRIDQDFALRRISEINTEVSVVSAMEESPALTAEGRDFIHHLFTM